jgi:DNA-binding NarL/FixJ family response regulator
MFYKAIKIQQGYKEDRQSYFLIEKDGSLLKKINKKVLDDNQKIQIINLTRKGWLVKDISELLGIAESTVYRYRREAIK